MENIKETNVTTNIIDAIVEGVRRKKGQEIIDLDLTKIDYSECNHFIVCHGSSNTQAEAIAHSIEETVKELTGQSALHTDGYRNAQWILLDYIDIMVHVFQESWRTHYDLESLWADAQIKKYNSKN
ncbi:MAG: ribosome silencing factor [Prolixibacteraceae bacterium]|jgi:ribosome-associated protein|nr:ribosome silencing factor [Prolixibacteraceae bacterium]